MPDTDVLTTANEITGTDDPTVFQSIRVGERFRYRFDVGPGTYLIRLFFAEIYWESSDAELQDVYINDRRVVKEYNIFNDVGHDTADVKEFNTRVREGGLEVRFVGRSLPMHSGARCCGIHVVKKG